MTSRLNFALVFFYFMFFCIVARLYYWQIIKRSSLQVAAQEQYQRTITAQGSRGRIYTADNYLLVDNVTVYRLFAQPKLIEQSPSELADKLLPLLLTDSREYQQATGDAKLTVEANLKNTLISKLEQKESNWESLFRQISEETKQKITDLNVYGLGFDPYEIRHYPQASMAATVTGFVGKNDLGEDVGYFGIEGALNRELAGKENTQIWHKNALGLVGVLEGEPAQNGRDISLTLRRDIQHTLETTLAKGMEKYGAQAGEVIVMDPKTGFILGFATSPKYDQQYFYEYDPALYKNPSVANTFEPGSTFKVLTVAAGIDAGAITPETTCPRCDGPRTIGKYTLKTWNNEYHPDISMKEALAKSDNVAMIYVAEELGADTLQEYIKRFGIGTHTLTDLQEDIDSPFPQKWGPVELATISFGQGISTTSLQLMRAISSIANQGVMMQPQIVSAVTNPVTGEKIMAEPREEARVVSPQTAQAVTEMMVYAAEKGEAQWIAATGTHTVAGKTGTAQIAVDGAYDPEKTIASFIGFAPADDPQFIMLVKLREPQSSIWASETAAPLWYEIASKLYLLLNIPPDK
ncbi:MAG TPA: penicillin-binding protein 2 [Patescibacteria group bacterium]